MKREQIIVDLTFWKNHRLTKQSKTHSPTILAQGGGYGICTIEIEYEDLQDVAVPKRG